MFASFKRLFRRSPLTPARDGAVSRWAASQFLSLKPGEAGQFSIEGQLQGHPFRAVCGPSSRPYIDGLELRVKVDLGLPPFGEVVVMSRAVRDALAGSARGDSPPSWRLADESRWMTHLVPTRWAGPPERFWTSYEVCSDEPELARRWLNSDAVEFLTLGDPDTAARVPAVISLTRGKCYLRLQVNPLARDADTLLVDKVELDGHTYSDKAPLQAFLAAPAYALGRAMAMESAAVLADELGRIL